MIPHSERRLARALDQDPRRRSLSAKVRVFVDALTAYLAAPLGDPP